MFKHARSCMVLASLFHKQVGKHKNLQQWTLSFKHARSCMVLASLSHKQVGKHKNLQQWTLLFKHARSCMVLASLFSQTSIPIYNSEHCCLSMLNHLLLICAATWLQDAHVVQKLRYTLVGKHKKFTTVNMVLVLQVRAHTFTNFTTKVGFTFFCDNSGQAFQGKMSSSTGVLPCWDSGRPW